MSKEGYCISAPAVVSTRPVAPGPAAAPGANRFGPGARNLPHQRQTFGKAPGAQYQTHLSGPASAVGAKKPASNFWQSRSRPTPKPWQKPTPKPTTKPAWTRPVTTHRATTRPATTRRVMTTTRRQWQQTTHKPAWTPPRTTTRAFTTTRWSTTRPTTSTTRFVFVQDNVETTTPFMQTSSTTRPSVRVIKIAYSAPEFRVPYSRKQQNIKIGSFGNFSKYKN